MKPTVLVAARLSPSAVERLADRYTVIGPIERCTPDAIPEPGRTARALVTFGALPTRAALLDALPKLGLIACYGSGYEGVELKEAARRGITVTHGPGANASTVADHAMALVLASTRLIVAGDRLVRAGRWPQGARLPMVPGLTGARLGVYGLGAIGTKVAARAAAFEMEVGYFSRTRRDVPYTYFPNLLALAEWSDILVVAVRADAGNRHAVDRKVLAALGPQGHVVNIARGSAIDEQALIEALETGVIAGAGLDVFADEPNVPERLKALENVVLTPHIGGNSHSANEAQCDLLLANLEAFFAGRPVLTPVPALSQQTVGPAD